MKGLSEKQTRLAEGKAEGMTDKEACNHAGYKPKSDQAAGNQVRRMMQNDAFRAFYDELRLESRKTSKMTRDSKLEMLARIATNQEEEDPRTSIAAITEENKMTGGYEPERHEMTFKVTIGGNGNTGD